MKGQLTNGSLSGSQFAFVQRKLIVFFLVISLVLSATGINRQVFAQTSKKVILNKQTLFLYEGEQARLKVTSKNPKVKWYSKKTKVARVTSTGLVKAMKSGTAKVYAKDKKTGKTAYCTVKVGKYISSMTLTSANSVILDAGATSQITTKVLPADSLYKDAVYEIKDNMIANVSEKGLITAVSPGTTTVTVKSKAATKKKRQLSTVVTIFVQSNLTASSPSITSPSSNAVVISENTGNNGQSGEETKVETLQEKINKIATPANNQLLAATFVTEENGNKSTLYFINKNYSGNITLSVNGIAAQGNMSAVSLLKNLETAQIVKTNSERTLRVSRYDKSISEWTDYWTITDLTKNVSYKLQAWQTDTKYNSPYGLIIAEGDTTNAIKIQ